MKLTIEVKKDERYSRRRLNNLLANCEREIHDFIVNGTTEELSSMPRMGNEEYSLEIKIEEE